ncbi:MAG: hypothetical protein ABRQ39_31840, partial [Candidatus Eremiobacterota bacterium]
KDALVNYIFSSHLYLNLYNKGLRDKKSSYYVDALEHTGSIYNITKDYVKAAIIYSRAVDFWLYEHKMKRNDMQILNLRINLADLYEKMGLFDMSRDMRQEIINKKCPDNLIHIQKKKLQSIVRECYPGNPDLKIARKKFLEKLTGISSQPNGVLTAVTDRYVNKLIETFKKNLGY